MSNYQTLLYDKQRNGVLITLNRPNALNAMNQDLMNDYQVPMERGIPAIAVLDDTGTLLFSQRGGEFESARSLGPDDILAFLDKWKPSVTKN